MDTFIIADFCLIGSRANPELHLKNEATSEEAISGMKYFPSVAKSDEGAAARGQQ